MRPEGDRNMKTMFAIVLFGVLSTGNAATTKPPARSYAGRSLVLVGEGARVKDGEKLYDMQMWIDEEDGKRAFPALAMRAGGKDKTRLVRGDHAPAFLVWGRFTKQAVFTFAKAVTAATMRDEIKNAIGDVPGGDAVVAMFGADAAAGDQWVLTTGDNGQIKLTVGETGDKLAPQSPKLERALWNIWLGNKPLSAELRRALVEKIDVLGR